MEYIRQFSLDVNLTGSAEYVNAKQYDTDGRKVLITIYEDGSPMDMTGITNANVRYLKPGGSAYVLYAATLTAEKKVEVTLTAAMLTDSGTAEADVQLIDSNNAIAGTVKFYVYIIPMPTVEEQATSTSEFEALERALAKAEGLASNLEIRTNGTYVQYSFDDGDTWTNLIPVADLPKGTSISSVVMNADYTLTFHFTDSTADYTTTSVRGAAGNGISSVTFVATQGQEQHEPGKLDKYRITYTDSSVSPFEFQVYNGADGDVTQSAMEEYVEDEIDEAIATKISLISNTEGTATGNLPKIKSDGSLEDSGAKISDYYTKTEVNLLISAAGGVGFVVEIVSELPSTGSTGKMYLMPNSGTSPNSYDEYIWIAADSAFEKIGNTSMTVTIDSAMSSTSTNPVQNKVIYEQIGTVETALSNLNTALEALL